MLKWGEYKQENKHILIARESLYSLLISNYIISMPKDWISIFWVSGKDLFEDENMLNKYILNKL